MDKKYLACGVGNAIADVIVNVSFQDLELLGLKADESCLIDIEKKNIIEKFIKDKNFKISSGGSIANSIYTISKLCGNGAFIGTLGDDDFGKSYFSEFINSNIALSKNIINKNIATGVCFVFVMPNAERTMAVYLGDCASINLKDDEKDFIANASYLVLEMYPISNDDAYNSMLEAIKIAKENDVKIVMSFSDKWVLDAQPQRVSEFVKLSDIIFCNNNEAQAFSKTASIHQMISFFKDRNDDKDYIITLGKNGAVAIKNGASLFVDAKEVTPVDLTGAGDMFLSSYIYAISIGLSKEEALNKACHMSSKIICKVGARLDGDLSLIWNS